MQLEPLEARSEGYSLLHRVESRFKLLLALFYVIAVFATRVLPPMLVLLAPAILVAWGAGYWLYRKAPRSDAPTRPGNPILRSGRDTNERGKNRGNQNQVMAHPFTHGGIRCASSTHAKRSNQHT